MNAFINNEKTIAVLNRVQQAITDIQAGKMVVMVDDEDRENEGDLVYAANFSTPQKVNFMASHAKGLICVAVSKKIATRLDLVPMVKQNNSSYETAFTISVDAVAAKTGISAAERDMTIGILANPISQPQELVRPGHIFPLIAKEGGSLVRTGHTEGSVDLCKLAGVGESAVICEIMKEDGTMARRPDLDIFCEEHELNIVYISDLVEYRMMKESLIQQTNELETDFLGQKVVRYDFQDHLENHHIAYTFGNITQCTNVKFHNIVPDCELFSSTKKFEELMNSISYLKEHCGVLIFMDSQAKNMDEIKEYGIGAQILSHLGIEEISLLSSSKTRELVGISGFGLAITNYIKP